MFTFDRCIVHKDCFLNKLSREGVRKTTDSSRSLTVGDDTKLVFYLHQNKKRRRPINLLLFIMNQERETYRKDVRMSIGVMKD